MAVSFLVFADFTTRTPKSSLTGSPFSFPTLTGGEDVNLALRFALTQNGTTSQVYPNLRALRASIGVTDTPPDGGNFALQIGAGASTTANTTPDLRYNITQGALQAALNALTVLAGVTANVATDGNAWVITFSDGQQRLITAPRNDLDPTCVVRVRTKTLTERTEHEITLVQAPVASTNAFTPIVPPAPSVVLVTAGGTDPSGTELWPTVQDVTIPSSFLGSFAFTFGGAQSSPLSASDGTDTIAAAINGMFSAAGQTVTVTNPLPNVAEVTFDGAAFMGAPQALLGILILSSPPGDPTLTLSLDTSECFQALRAGDTISKTFFLSVDADICADGIDPTTATIWQTVTLFRVPVTLQRPINWPGLESAAPLNWAAPPGPQSYIPFGSNNLIFGQQFYCVTLGDAATNSFTITHNLGTQNLHITLFRNGAPWTQLIPGGDYVASVPTANSVGITFPSAPAAAAVNVVMSTAGPVASFVAGLTVTEAQVTGLVTDLSNLNTTVSELAGLLPSTGVGVTSSAGNASVGITIPLTLKSEVIGFQGASLPAPSANGTGYANAQFPHRAPALTPSSAFDRELWRVPVNASALVVGRKMAIDWGVSLQILRPSCAAEYQLVVEIGTYTTSGSSLVIAWNTTAPVFSQPVVLTEELVIHSFGISIARNITGLTLSQQLYGIWSGNNAAAPASANFAIRCRLIGLEVESVSDPRGFIYFAVVPSGTAASGVTQAQAVISTP